MPIKYDLEWEEGIDDLSIELKCFRCDHKEIDGGLGAAGHFKRAVELLWGPNNKRKHFQWHPWALKMLEASCRYQYLSVSGPGNVGKSDFFAVWALINWLCDPVNTMVIVTSTTMNASRKRIWGSIVDYYGAVPGMPGRLADSVGIIRTYDPSRKIKVSDKAGISLVAGEASKEKESMDKLDGCHNKRVIMIGDELPKLSPGLVKFATGNLSKNPFFQFIGIGNPTSKYDPHGILSTPRGGWDSISEKDYEWETKLGYAIRFDSEQSPNVLAEKVIYDFLPTVESVAMSKHQNGEDSLVHWSQCRGFWPPDGSDPECVYSEADMVAGDVTDTEVKWSGDPVPISSCDPARGSGGDVFKAIFGLYGTRVGGQKTILITKALPLTESRSDPTPYSFQIAKQYAALCREHGVKPENVAYDSTGAAGEFGQVLTVEFDNAVLHQVNFNGKPSEIPHGVDQRPCSELYADKVSELWMVGKDYIRSGQIKGLTAEIIDDMLSRKEVLKKQGLSGMKRAVESKRVMKKRIKRSPDSGDSFFVLLDLCRKKFNFRSEIAIVANRNAKEKWSASQREVEQVEFSAVPTNVSDIGVSYGQPKRARWTPEEEDEEADYIKAFHE